MFWYIAKSGQTPEEWVKENSDKAPCLLIANKKYCFVEAIDCIWFSRPGNLYKCLDGFPSQDVLDDAINAGWADKTMECPLPIVCMQTIGGSLKLNKRAGIISHSLHLVKPFPSWEEALCLVSNSPIPLDCFKYSEDDYNQWFRYIVGCDVSDIRDSTPPVTFKVRAWNSNKRNINMTVRIGEIKFSRSPNKSGQLLYEFKLKDSNSLDWSKSSLERLGLQPGEIAIVKKAYYFTYLKRYVMI